MRIQKAILSIDDNPLFDGLWPLVSKVWRLRFDIDPVLIYFGNKWQSEKYGEVIHQDLIDGIPSHSHAQWARFWFTSVEPEAVFVTSDIDIFPISRSFFLDQLSDESEDSYVHLFGMHRPLPVCYHVAKGKNFSRVLELGDTFAESLKAVVANAGDHTHMGMSKWCADESYSTKKIEKYNGEDLVLFPRVAPSSERLDRSRWNSDFRILDSYIDSHSLRPYSLYKNEIDRLVDRLTLEK